MVLPRLKCMTLRNATMSVTHVSALVQSHQATVREFYFESVALLHGGSWGDSPSPRRPRIRWARYLILKPRRSGLRRTRDSGAKVVVRTATLANEFAAKGPAHAFSTAELQGFLMKSKRDPAAAVASADERVVATCKEKKQKELEEVEERRRKEEEEKEAERKGESRSAA